MIEFQGLGKKYNNKWALRNLDLKINEGEIFCLLGPNGAGKTTTIRMSTGLIRPTEGKVLINAHDIIKSHIEAKRLTGYVPDKSYLYEQLTGREFILFSASLYGITGKKAKNKSEELLHMMGISDTADDLIKNYSHGMRQRLVFASALLHEPRALIIDEPFVGLDPYGVRTIKALLTDLASTGVAIILATHSLHIAQDICHRAGIIHKGKLVTTIKQEDFNKSEGGLEQMFIEHTS